MQQINVSSVCLELLRNPPARAALERLAKQPGHDTTPVVARALMAANLCERGTEALRLTRLGRSLAYHLCEYRNQIENGAAESFVSRLDVQDDSRVLDIGCGGGQSLIALLRQRPRIGVGLEWDVTAHAIFSALREYEQMDNALPVCGDAEALPFADHSFDRILCRVVLMHVRVRPTLAEIARVSQVGGLIYLHLTDFWFYWRKLLRLRLERGGVPFALLNGVLLQLFAVQIRMRATRTMSYQTVGTVTRRLEKHGFEILEVEQDRSNLLAASHRQPKILARLERPRRSARAGR